jgi:hypothetical protein
VWDWSRRIFDHVDLRASDFAASVRFHETVLAPLGIRKLFEDGESACALPRRRQRGGTASRRSFAEVDRGSTR